MGILGVIFGMTPGLSDCFSVAVSDVPAVTDVCVLATSLVSVRCEVEFFEFGSGI